MTTTAPTTTSEPPFLVPLEIKALRDAGVPEPFAFGHADRVRFGELDVLDHVNNAVYLKWFETLRVAYLQAYGVHDYGGGDEKPALVLKRITADFHAPLHLAQPYVVAGRTRAFRRTSFSMEYRVYAEGVHRTTGEAIICLTERDGTTKRALPDAWTEAFAARDGAAREG